MKTINGRTDKTIKVILTEQELNLILFKMIDTNERYVPEHNAITKRIRIKGVLKDDRDYDAEEEAQAELTTKIIEKLNAYSLEMGRD